MKRIKLSTSPLKTRAEAEAVARETAKLIIQLRSATNDMDSGITHIRKQYEGRLAALNTAIEEKTAVLRDWAESNPSEFGNHKSIDLTHAVVGWRVGNPTLKTITGWTWDRVLEKLRSIASPYVRTKDEVNKQQLIADRQTLGDSGLRELGVRVVQDEPFYVEPKLTDQDARITTEAAA